MLDRKTTDPLAGMRARARAIRQAGGVEQALEQGLQKVIETTLSEALVLGLLKQGVRKYFAIFGHGSTDLGNVSRAVPTSSLTFAISEVPINGHSKEVVEGSISEMGRENALRTGKALALAALELLTDEDAYETVRQEFVRTEASAR